MDSLFKGWYRCRRGLLLTLIGTAMCAGVVVIGGCAISQDDDGSFVIGFRTSGSGATASGLGNAAGGFLGALGVPGAAAIGGTITGVLGLLGVGIKAASSTARARAAEATIEADRKAWTEADAYYGILNRNPPTLARPVDSRSSSGDIPNDSSRP